MPGDKAATPAPVDEQSAVQRQNLTGSDVHVGVHVFAPVSFKRSLPGIIVIRWLARDSVWQTVARIANALRTPSLVSPSKGIMMFGAGVTSNIVWQSSSKQPSIGSCCSNTASSAGT